MSNIHPQIWVDSREASTKPGSAIVDSLRALGAEVQIENLGNAVDYLIPSLSGVRHAIQRKTANEMVSPKHTFEDIIQIKAMENTEPYILLEGSLGMIQKWSKMPIAPIIGGIESILIDFDVKIIPSPNRYWSANWIFRRAVKLGTVKVKKPMSLGEKIDRELPLHEQGRRIIETLPDIGPRLAIRIMEQFNTAKNALDNVESWTLVGGIAEGKMQKIREVLNAQWNGTNKLNNVQSSEVGSG